MTRPFAGLAALATVLALGACTTTDNTTTATSATETEPSFAPIAPDAALGDLLDEIEMLMFDLDERIIDESGHVAVMARIDEVWFAAETQIRANDPDDVFNFEQAVTLARTGVERRRPADASKGYKIFVDVNDAYTRP